MPNIVTRRRTLRVKAFTLLETLLVMATMAFLVLSLSGSVKQIFQRVEETLFFLSFEQFYRDTQKWSAYHHQPQTLVLSANTVSNGRRELVIPETVTLTKSYQLLIDKTGGNSSLGKIQFDTDQKTVSYQLYIGSGNYKKTETKRVHTP